MARPTTLGKSSPFLMNVVTVPQSVATAMVGDAALSSPRPTLATTHADIAARALPGFHRGVRGRPLAVQEESGAALVDVMTSPRVTGDSRTEVSDPHKEISDPREEISDPRKEIGDRHEAIGDPHDAPDATVVTWTDAVRARAGPVSVTSESDPARDVAVAVIDDALDVKRAPSKLSSRQGMYDDGAPFVMSEAPTVVREVVRAASGSVKVRRAWLGTASESSATTSGSTRLGRELPLVASESARVRRAAVGVDRESTTAESVSLGATRASLGASRASLGASRASS